jgi:hypothetical protein
MSLRVILLIGNALLLAFFAYVVIDSSIIHPHKEPSLLARTPRDADMKPCTFCDRQLARSRVREDDDLG